jgi:uncharacterized membrane protein YdfJ with MMPL/SSD domain
LTMIGVALAAGVLIDATLVRGIALPAAASLLGRRGIKGQSLYVRASPSTAA